MAILGIMNILRNCILYTLKKSDILKLPFGT